MSSEESPRAAERGLGIGRLNRSAAVGSGLYDAKRPLVSNK